MPLVKVVEALGLHRSYLKIYIHEEDSGLAYLQMNPKRTVNSNLAKFDPTVTNKYLMGRHELCVPLMCALCVQFILPRAS